jgi:hypothetical protein
MQQLYCNDENSQFENLAELAVGFTSRRAFTAPSMQPASTVAGPMRTATNENARTPPHIVI